MRQHRDIAQDFSQKKLKAETSGGKKEKIILLNNVWDEEKVRNNPFSMVIMHDDPLSMVEHVAFNILTCLNMKNSKQ